jgi:hypothetical protein
MKKKRIYLLAAVLLVAVNCAFVNAQVVIGSATQQPAAAAILDLSKKDASANANLGLLLPNISLTSTTMPLPAGTPEEGMLVYCPSGATLPQGLYVWNGSEWKKCQ